MSVVSPTVMITVQSVPQSALSLGVDRTEGYLGDTFIFSGFLSIGGSPVSGSTVTLYQNGLSVGSAPTNASGNFSIPWVADIEGSISFHVEAPQPSLPPLKSPSMGLRIGMEIPSMTTLIPLAIVAVILGYIISK